VEKGSEAKGRVDGTRHGTYGAWSFGMKGDVTESFSRGDFADGDGGEEWLRYVEGFGLVLQIHGAEITGLSHSVSSHVSG
jgi:galactokinase